MTPIRRRSNKTIGNWKPIPIKAEVRKTVVKRPLMSKMLPMPKETDLAKKISICHFMITAPIENPIKKRKIEKGKNLTTILNSFILRAGFKKYKTWTMKRGRAITNPVAIPQLMARLINWKGEVKTILMPSSERAPIKNLIISS